jgi:hypothetical protein
MFIRRFDKRFKEGWFTNCAPVSFEPEHRERKIISAAGNNSCPSRHFITECQIREDSGRSKIVVWKDILMKNPLLRLHSSLTGCAGRPIFSLGPGESCPLLSGVEGETLVIYRQFA